MRILVFFDLPVTSGQELRDYRTFRRYLIKNGFMMMQQSVYVKLALNSTAAGAVVENIRKNKPPAGLVQLLTVTEKQFSRMEFIVGSHSTEVLDSDERLVIF